MDETTKAWYDAINAQQQQNNAWSAAQAQKAMDYQREMSNTAHQREVADLKAAGLNPVLSAGGSGATTGSGIAASSGNENVTALYGLAKQAIEANIEQARAMENSAKYISGSAGVGNPFSFNGDVPPDFDPDSAMETVEDVLDTFFPHREKTKEDEFFDNLSERAQLELAKRIARATGYILSTKDVQAIMNAVGVDKNAIYRALNATVRWRFDAHTYSALEANRQRLNEDNDRQMNSYYSSSTSSSRTPRKNTRDVKN